MNIRRYIGSRALEYNRAGAQNPPTGRVSMIVSASYRTDIPAFYGPWFENRLDAGYCRVANSYGGAPYRVALDRGSVDGFVFWTRNPGPFMATLDRLAGTGYPFVIHITITGYKRILETSVIEPARAIELVRQIAGRFGPRVAVWRYDPIIETDASLLSMHAENFARLADGLAGATDEAVVSFAGLYRKTRRNLGRAGLEYGDPPDAAKNDLLAELAGLAAARGMALSVCTQPALAAPGTRPARCIDSDRLSALAGRPIASREKANRPGCACHESRDIGAYDTCPHGCVYCYAVATRAKARAAHAAHDPENEFLL